ncbi:MAG: flippase activity-associated protein Agl23 [Sedimentisphaeraceae bacterium JB056]
MRQKLYIISILTVLIIGAASRLWLLDVRPMHTDEAVHAVKFGYLLEDNYYRYDPSDYHGPILNYLTLIPVKLAGIKVFEHLSEFDLRIVPAFGGILLMLMPLFLWDTKDRRTSLICCFLIAVSPALVYYSRYYIQEIFLVLFSYGFVLCFCNYLRRRKPADIILAGLFLGLMIVTKETFIISIAAIVPAFTLANANSGGTKLDRIFFKNIVKTRHAYLFIFIAAGVYVLFYSSFFSNMSGISYPVSNWGSYAAKGAGESVHNHPWYYYLKLLLYSKASNGFVFSEALILLTAALGCYEILFSKRAEYCFQCRFIAAYSVSLLLIYSVIPYKTPWCMLTFYYGFTIVAAIYWGRISTCCCLKMKNIAASAIICIIICVQLIECYFVNFVFYCDSSNPYAYSHPTEDVKMFSLIIDEYREVSGYEDISIAVAASGNDYWPLPWYLRKFSNVGYYDDVEQIKDPFDVVVVSEKMNSSLAEMIYDREKPGERSLWIYLSDNQLEIRPDVRFDVYAKDFNE